MTVSLLPDISSYFRR